MPHLTPAHRKRHRKGEQRRRTSLIAALMALTLALAGCVGAPATPDGKPFTADPDIIGSIPDNLREFYTQQVEWKSCENSYQCATIKVPLDYANPGDRSISLELIKSPARGEKKGSLLINPGGPGGSGVDSVLESAQALTTQPVRDAYDVVGFDPRGVKRSTPVTCYDAQGTDEYRATYNDPSTPEGMAAAREVAKAFGQACADNSKGILDYVGTENAARDLDIIRALVGDKKLNYLGFSYGTLLGATYANIFPKNVGRFVLDGAVDPSISSSELTLGQAAGFEKAFRAYVTDCLSGSNCPLTGSVDEGLATIKSLIEEATAQPLQARDGRMVNGSLMVSGLILPLYSQANWPALTQALEELVSRRDPTTVLLLADLSADREADGTYSGNSMNAFTAVNCLDYPADASDEQMRAQAAQLEKVSPTIGKYLAYGDVGCQEWPVKANRTPAPISAEGAGDILVVGTTGDPATPYEWSVSLADQLSSGTLLTYEGEGHTAYGRANACLNDAVDKYLLDGTVPAEGMRC